MELTTNSFDHMARIPAEFAFCDIDPENHATFSANRNPHLAWAGLPDATKSLALVVHDSDVPSKGDDVNQEDREVPADLERVDFYHWVLVDLDPSKGSIAAGEFSDGVTERGKEGPQGPAGTRRGINDYTNWFAGDEDMGGDYYGYDGPCPPWNDSIIHHYHFTLYALDVDQCPVEGRFTGDDVLEAIEGHILDQASITGTYTLNPDLA